MVSEPSGASHTPPRLLGDHAVLGLLGEGGMGSLYLARSIRAGGFTRLFAIKVLHPHLARQSLFANMLLDEARISGRIQHPNVISVFDVVEAPPTPFIVMDYVHGETLSLLFRECIKKGSWIPRELSVYIARNVLEGLHVAHELKDQQGNLLGIVHRDVSPSNIMLGYDGTVRVMDFGVAKARDNIVLTRTDAVRGTYAYMSPEYIDERKVDRRADIFAVGTILWEATTGKRLFKGRSDVNTAQKVLRAHVPDPRILNPGCPDDLAAIILRALSKRPEDRFATARAMAEALDQHLRTADPVGPGALEQYLREQLPERFAERERVRCAALDPDGPIAELSSLLASSRGSGTASVAIEESSPVSDPVSTPALEGARDLDALEATRSAAEHAFVSPPRRSSKIGWAITAVATSFLVLGWIAWTQGALQESPAPEVAAAPAPALAPSREPDVAKEVKDVAKDAPVEVPPDPAKLEVAGDEARVDAPSAPSTEAAGKRAVGPRRARQTRGVARREGAPEKPGFLVIEGSDL